MVHIIPVGQNETANPGQPKPYATGDTVAGVICLLGTVSVDAKTIANHTIYTVPTGKNVNVIGIAVRCTAVTGGGNGPDVCLGTNSATFNNIIPVTDMKQLNLTTEGFMIETIGIYHPAIATEVITARIDAVATTTTMTVAIDVFGYII